MIRLFYTVLVIFLCASYTMRADLTDEAYTTYVEAEKADDNQTRKKLFNEALSSYLKLETDNASGPLLYAIANTYFQLGEYGYAVLYYTKAQKLLPRDTKIQHNVAIARQKAGLAPQNSLATTIFFFHYDFSYNEKLIACLTLLLVSFALLSLYIWFRNIVWFKKGAFCILFISFVIFLSLSWQMYLAPLDAVIVRPTALRVDAGMQYAPLGDTPILPGMEVEVMAIERDGDWLQVRLKSGQKGYIAKEYVRIV